MEVVFEKCRATRDAGQKEYAHSEQNALRNFEQTGADVEIPSMKVWYIFAKKHWDGVLSYIRGHRSQREDVRGRIMDLIVYLILLWAMIDDQETNNNGRSEQPSVRKQGEGSSQQGVPIQGHERSEGWQEVAEVRA